MFVLEKWAGPVGKKSDKRMAAHEAHNSLPIPSSSQASWHIQLPGTWGGGNLRNPSLLSPLNRSDYTNGFKCETILKHVFALKYILMPFMHKAYVI